MTEIQVGGILHIQNDTVGDLLLMFGPSGESVLAFTFDSEDEGETLSGTVTYVEGKPITFKATRIRQNWYDVEIEVDPSASKWDSVNQWQLGTREDKNIEAMDITYSDKEGAFTGTITYVGEEPNQLAGTIEKVGLLYTVEEIKVEPIVVDHEPEYLVAAPRITPPHDKPVAGSLGGHLPRPTESSGTGGSK